MSSNHYKFQNSSVCNHCDYDESTNKLTLKFHSSTLAHTFLDVPKVIYDNLKAADMGKKSIGGYFHQNIRGKFRNGPMTPV